MLYKAIWFVSNYLKLSGLVCGMWRAAGGTVVMTAGNSAKSLGCSVTAVGRGIGLPPAGHTLQTRVRREIAIF